MTKHEIADIEELEAERIRLIEENGRLRVALIALLNYGEASLGVSRDDHDRIDPSDYVIVVGQVENFVTYEATFGETI